MLAAHSGGGGNSGQLKKKKKKQVVFEWVLALGVFDKMAVVLNVPGTLR